MMLASPLSTEVPEQQNLLATFGLQAIDGHGTPICPEPAPEF